jgi:hypothetical protein
MVMSEEKDGCVKPAAGPMTGDEPTGGGSASFTAPPPKPRARVGAPAIDFEANAFVKGVGFKQIRLSDYKGKWVVLCFYPGDFTFV